MNKAKPAPPRVGRPVVGRRGGFPSTQLTGEQLLLVCLVPVALGALMFIAVVFALRRDTLELFRSDNGGLLLRVFALTFVAFWVGNLTLAGKVPESAATAIFGSILGYVFGVGAGPGARPARPADKPQAASEKSGQ